LLNPKKDLTPLTVFGGIQSLIPASFVGSIDILLGFMMKPKYSTSVALKMHFSGLRNKSFSLSHLSTWMVLS